jgi:hypothetical protein
MYPTAAVVPLNLLRIYTHFSSPMSEGYAGRAVRVTRADTGEPLRDVFYRGRSELWDSGRRRLTLLLDPGRIKRGLLPHETSGYPLIEGVPFRLSVSEEFRDESGIQLRCAATREYGVGPPLRTRVDPEGWEVRAPVARSTEPLEVRFGRPLDRALLEHGLAVRSGAGDLVAGEFIIGAAEVSAAFHPAAPWRPGTYVLEVDPRLEDIAGNSSTRVFDRDLTLTQDDPATPKPLLFRVE